MDEEEEVVYVPHDFFSAPEKLTHDEYTGLMHGLSVGKEHHLHLGGKDSFEHKLYSSVHRKVKRILDSKYVEGL